MEQGFVDLRLNHGESRAEESFWPSFTDIMTVVVMIFLMAMVILLVRNLELVNQLRATMEAERMAAELARTTGEEKESLAMRLFDAENQLSELRLQLMRMRELTTKQQGEISQQRGQLRDLSNERDRQALRIEQLNTETQRLTDKLASTTRSFEGLRQDYAQLDQRHQTATRELESMRRTYQQREQELKQSQDRLQEAASALDSLQGEYGDLKVKYDKLVRPARTPQGKYVVEVRYAKRQGSFQIEYREAEDQPFQTVSRTQLESRLDELKRQYPDKLYIKVIFPEQSGLSYNEAWSFTSHLHKNYDYYFQDAASGTAE